MAKTAKHYSKDKHEPTPTTGGKGTVLPPGVAPPVAAPLEEGTVTVKILSVDPENGYDENGNEIASDYRLVKCEYPPGFAGEYVKHHQVNDVGALCEKIINTLRGRHGYDHAVAVSKAPKALKAGLVVELEVSR